MVAKIFQAIAYWPTYLLFKFFLRYDVEGAENLKGLEDKAIIFASNHASYIDGPISAASMPRYGGDFYPRRFFPIRFLALNKCFPWFFGNIIPFPLSLVTSAYLRASGAVKVFKSGGNLDLSLSEAIKELKKGARLWIFPEGGLTTDGKLRQGKRGVAYLHRQTGVPVVPVALQGNYKILSPKTLLRKNRVTVKIGKPMYSLNAESLEDGVDAIMKEIGKLLENNASGG